MKRHKLFPIAHLVRELPVDRFCGAIDGRAYLVTQLTPLMLEMSDYLCPNCLRLYRRHDEPKQLELKF